MLPPPVSAQSSFALKTKQNSIIALEVFGFEHYLTGPSDHLVDVPDDTSELKGSSWI
jgi:hypothetical protein